MDALGDVKALRAVAEERGHRDAAVLDLGVAEPSDGLRRRSVGDAQWVVEADRRVQLDRERLEVRLALGLRGRGPDVARVAAVEGCGEGTGGA